MERTKADEALHIGQVFASLDGVLAITLSGVGVIVRSIMSIAGLIKSCTLTYTISSIARPKLTTFSI